MIQRILPVYYFTLECLYLYFLLFIFYIRSGEIPPLTTFIAVWTIAILVLFYSLKQKKVSTTVPLIGTVVLGGVSYLLGLAPISVFLIMVFLYIRIIAFIKDSSLWREVKSKLAIIFYCSALVIFLIGAILKYPHMNWLFGIVIVFTLLLTIGRYLQQVAGNNSARNFQVVILTIIAAALFSVIIIVLVPIAKFLFVNFWEGVILFIALLTMSIFKLVEQITLIARPKDRWGEGDIDVDARFSKKQEEIGEIINQTAFVPSYVWFGLSVVVIITLWFFLRKRKAETSVSNSVQYKRTPTSAIMGKKGVFFREPAPNDYIRKLFYQLQIYSEKYGYGRFEHETMREWFDRVNFQKNEELFLAYDHVRYGGKVIHKHDAKFLEEFIRNLKREMKERIKKEKDKEA